MAIFKPVIKEFSETREILDAMQVATQESILDIGDFYRLGKVANIVENTKIETINIDHHPLTENDFALKADLISKYDIQKDKSYSKIGYYLSDEYLNIGKSYVMENYVRLYMQKHKYFDIYNLKKWSSE